MAIERYGLTDLEPLRDLEGAKVLPAPEMLLFSSDFPHVEGGRNPLKRFNDSLDGLSDQAKRRFFRDNFIDLLGKGLDPALYDLPQLAAA